jgi:para-nitrobenzyl esterase
MTQPPPTVHFESGTIQGLALEGLELYIEIPYGADTSGIGRFRPPAPVEPWEGVRRADAWTTRAPQYLDGAIGRTPKQWFAIQGEYYAQGMSEDNLTVNIWTPDSTTGFRPVVFWIHGGGFTVGHAGSPMSDGAAFARSHDVVFVSVTHRLNAFGFLDLEGIAGPEFADSGLVGMLDLVAALEWVQRNIAAFGGDPGNVTIIGESGGGGKVSTLLVMDRVDGLFHRAVCESGIAMSAITRADSEAYARGLITELGGTDASALLSASMGELLDAQVRLERAQPDLATPRPVIDGNRLPGYPEEIWASGGGSAVPVLAGSAHDEVAVFGAVDLDIDVQIPDFYRHGFGVGEPTLLDEGAGLAALDRAAGRDASPLVALRRAAYPDESDSTIVQTLLGDLFFRHSAIKLAEYRAASDKQTWLYRLDWASPRIAPRGAPHSTSVSLFFDNTELVDFTRGLADAEAVSRDMSGSLDALMRTGSPEHTGLANWSPYTKENPAVMLFNSPSHISVDPDGDIMRAYDALDPKPLM